MCAAVAPMTLDCTIVGAGPSYGDADSLPKDVAAVANLRHNVLAWQTIEPSNADTLMKYVCCTTAGPLIALPCFWPHLCILGIGFGGCACAGARAQVEAIKHTYWVLTERDLLLVTTDHGNCFCPIHGIALCTPPLASSGNQVKAIPLENLTDISTDNKGRNCFQACVPDYSYMSANTASSVNVGRGQPGNEGVLVGFNQEFDLRGKILDQRDIVKDGPKAPVAQAVVRSDDGKSAKEKIKDLKEMLDDGLISQSEFDQKKADILANM